MSLHAFGKVGRPVGARIGSFRSATRAGCLRILDVVTTTIVLVVAMPAMAQQAAQPAYDPRQIERQLESQQPAAPTSRPPLRLPQLGPDARPASVRGPQFELRQIAVTGAHAIPAEAIASVYQ